MAEHACNTGHGVFMLFRLKRCLILVWVGPKHRSFFVSIILVTSRPNNHPS